MQSHLKIECAVTITPIEHGNEPMSYYVYVGRWRLGKLYLPLDGRMTFWAESHPGNEMSGRGYDGTPEEQMNAFRRDLMTFIRTGDYAFDACIEAQNEIVGA